MSSAHRPLLKPPRRTRAAQWAPLVVLALGLAAMALLLAVDALRQSLVTRDFALLQTVDDLRLDLTTSHLWMEEWVTGDDIPRRRIWDGIERSRAALDELLGAGPAPSGSGRLRRGAVADARLLGAMRALAQEVERFAAIQLRREHGRARGETVGAGSAIDVEYDRAFAAAAAAAETLRAVVESRLENELARARAYSRSIVAGWTAVVVAAFLGMVLFERRRWQAEEALLDRETQLLQAQKMEAVGRLAGGIAHDINNYLATISAQAELGARQATPGDRVVRRLEDVVATAHRASALLERLLAFSRRQPVRPEVVDLNLLVAGLEPMFHNLLGEDVELDTRLAPDLGSVLVDPAQVEQVLVNLLVNAREAMPRRGRVLIETENTSFDAVDVERRPVTRPGEYVMLSVSDTGEGIPPDVQTRLFEPFFTTKGERGNSGLGLATVYGIVKQNGGNVWAYSEPGKGATFRVYLPRTLEVPAAHTAQPARPRDLPRGSGHLLLVEDNRDLRESTQGLLESMGYRVVAAADGAEALLRLESSGQAFDLVIADVVMPGMSGPELVERLRARAGPVPVLYVSGYSEGVVGYHGLLTPEADFLAKPFTADALARKVGAALGRDGPPAVTAL